MRLIDIVANAPAAVELTDGAGQRHVVPGIGAKIADIRSCDLRYILDKNASDECMKLVTSPSNGLFQPDSPLLRMPEQAFWVEWFGTESQKTKVGLLVESSPDGRSGILTGYFQDEYGHADKIGACLEFNLDSPCWPASAAEIRMRHAEYPHLNDLLSCATLHIESEWERFFRSRSSDDFARTMNDLAANSWYFLPTACAFAAMINSPELLIATSSDLARLNAARRRRGSPPLLDHIEISIRLGQVPVANDRSGVHSGKSPPRLHHVRGHFVRRAGKTFWRSAHLRGDGEGPVLRKTVRVRGPDRQRVRLAARARAGA